MATNTGYDFYIDGLKLPFAPPSLEIKVNGRNETVTLINQGDINILKSPGLTEISFEMRLPQQQYPFAGELYPVSTYTDKLKELMEEKKSFQFIVVRTLPNGTSLFDTDLTVAVEEWTMKEDADEGFDVLIDVTLKQWVDYGVKTVEIKETGYKDTKNRDTGSKGTTDANYTVVKGDCLWNIAKKYYGDGSKWRLIYEANKASIEATAKKYGKSSSRDGHWIYPGQKLIIPGITTGTGSNKSGSSKSSSAAKASSSNKTREESKANSTKEGYTPPASFYTVTITLSPDKAASNPTYGRVECSVGGVRTSITKAKTTLRVAKGTGFNIRFIPSSYAKLTTSGTSNLTKTRGADGSVIYYASISKNTQVAASFVVAMDKTN